jgi:hypothetical protein
MTSTWSPERWRRIFPRSPWCRRGDVPRLRLEIDPVVMRPNHQRHQSIVLGLFSAARW